MLGCPKRKEANKGYLHRSDGADHVPCGIRCVQAVVEAAHQDKYKCVERDHYPYQFKFKNENLKSLFDALLVMKT